MPPPRQRQPQVPAQQLADEGSSDDEGSSSSSDEEADYPQASTQQAAVLARVARLSQAVSRGQGGSQRQDQPQGAPGSPGAGQQAGPSTAPGPKRNQLAAYLPEPICAVFRAKGITGDLYKWQVGARACALA
jgi:hypothetical protein